MDDTTLTIMQRRFVNEYIEHQSNATAAARAAGYSGDDNSLAAMGSHLLRNDKVRACIDERLEAEEVTPNWIIRNLKRVAGLSLTAPEITKTEYDRSGNVKSVSYDTGVIVKANEALAKIRGMGRERVDINITNQPVRQLLYLSPDHPLRARIEENHEQEREVSEGTSEGAGHDDENVEGYNPE